MAGGVLRSKGHAMEGMWVAPGLLLFSVDILGCEVSSVPVFSSVPTMP